MKTLSTAAIALALSASLSGVVDQPQDATATGSIAGRIVAADTGKPLQRAQIRMVADTPAPPRFAETDAQGRYVFARVGPGRYHVYATAERYLPLEYGQQHPDETGKPIDVGEGARFERADFRLPRTGAIEGRLLDEFGDPAPNIIVQLSRLEFAGGRRRLIPYANRIEPRPTDDKGRFRIFAVAPGDYYVTAVAGAFTEQNATGGFAATYYPGTADVGAATPVHVGVSQDMSNVTFTLVPAPMSRVSGAVVNADGLPVGLATVWLAQSDRARTIDFTVAQGLADRTGNFSFRNVPPGRYVIQAFGLPVGGGNLGRSPFGWLSVSPNGVDLTGLVVKIRSGTSARGRVAFEGTAPRPSAGDIRVAARPIEFESSPYGGGPPPYAINDDWTFELGNQFGLRVLRPTVASEAWMLGRIVINGKDVSDDPIDFSKEDVTDIEVVFTDRVTSVRGGVTSADGTAISTYSIVVFAADKARWTYPSRFVALGRPNQDGRFTIRALPPEQYRIVALPTVQESEWQDPEFLEKIWYAATPITVGEGENKVVDLKLTAPRP